MSGNHHVERLRLMWPVRGKIATALCFMSVTVALQLLVPRAIADFIDQAASGRG